jgi:hypothetical protein
LGNAPGWSPGERARGTTCVFMGTGDEHARAARPRSVSTHRMLARAWALPGRRRDASCTHRARARSPSCRATVEGRSPNQEASSSTLANGHCSNRKSRARSLSVSASVARGTGRRWRCSCALARAILLSKRPCTICVARGVLYSVDLFVEEGVSCCSWMMDGSCSRMSGRTLGLAVASSLPKRTCIAVGSVSRATGVSTLSKRSAVPVPNCRKERSQKWSDPFPPDHI